jgi:D-arabinose 1-dehydrogenase-like Zn-dependent alcohol dehydrogenase
VDVRPGDVVLVAPATGSFGGAAVHVALALGAAVIAMARNGEVLKELEEAVKGAYPAGRVKTVVMTGGVEGDLDRVKLAARELGKRDGMVDVYFDMSPPNASDSSHIKAGVLALRPKGRMSLMGGAAGDVGFPYYQIMLKGLRLQGSWMFTPEQVDEVIRLVEAGILKLGETAGVKSLGVFELEEWEEAFRVAGDEARVGRFALFAPNGKTAK